MFSFFEKMVDPFPAAEPGCPPDGLSRFIWYFARQLWPALLALTVVVAIVSGLEVALFAFLGNIVDWLSSADRKTFLAREGRTLWLMAGVVLVVLPAFTLLHALLLHQTIFGNFPMLVRWKAHRYVLGQSLEFYNEEFAGRIAAKIMQASLGIREVIMKVLDVLVYVTVYFIGALVLVASFDVWLMVPFLVWLAGYATMLSILLPRMKAISKRQADARSDMTGRVIDSYTNIMTVKLFAHAGREVTYARGAMDGFMQTVYPQMRIATLLHIGLHLLNAGLLLSVAGVALWSWTGGSATVGAVAVGTGLVLRLAGISHWIMWEMSSLFENIGMVHDGMMTIARQRSVTDLKDAPPLKIATGQVAFEAIRFHYGKQKGVIENLDLTIRPGEKVGLVGRSGSGKTTLMNVLLRLYDLEGGRITIDGEDISKVSQQSLRQAIGVVTQDTSLLHRSVADNIAYGTGTTTRDDIIKAAKRARAHDFILDLQDARGRTGYEAHVGERGVKLSGGQRQRIAIARMFLKDAPILVLDEATSALDSEVEAAIQDSLYALMQGKTVIAIAHRLSTIAALDRLVVLDEGKIIEQGPHADLIASDGLYASLWQRQSGGFICNEDEPVRAAE